MTIQDDQTPVNEAANEAADGVDNNIKINELTSALEAAKTAANEQRDAALRARAEVENMRRRFERDLENAHKYALEKFVMELIPVVDGMSLGLSAVTNPSPEVKKFLEGSVMTLRMLQSAMEKFGVKELDPVGEKFNPDRHMAMSMQESAEHAPNTVLTVVQKGYVLADRLIRPAMVVVAKPLDKPQTNSIDEMA